MLICDRCGSGENVKRYSVGVFHEADPGIEPRFRPLQSPKPGRFDLCQACITPVADSVAGLSSYFKRPELRIDGH